MRIISGKYRGRRLKSPPSLQTRPTSDRLRETLFNILAPRIEGVRFLDLCAGTGAVGIEALSRGAAHVTFVDQARKMCGLIERNLEDLNHEEDNVELVCVTAMDFLKRFSKQDVPPFEMIFFDPPYASNYEEVLEQVSRQAASLLTSTGIIIVEHYKKTSLPEEFVALKRYRGLTQGDSCLSFYRRR
jgi:16S rRNA (guanine(966)-N(2))-methyltransferase RsmD